MNGTERQSIYGEIVRRESEWVKERKEVLKAGGWRHIFCVGVENKLSLRFDF